MPQPPDAKATDQSDKHCYGTSQPRLSCDAISAQAAIDQARDADKQAAAVWWQFGVGALTLAAAVAAAIFAWLAAHHTKRSADAADESLLITKRQVTAQLRPHLSVKVRKLDFDRLPQDDARTIISLNYGVDVTNVGGIPAKEIRAGAIIKELPWPPKDEDIVDLENPELAEFGVIHPGVTTEYSFKKPIWFQADQQISGSVRVYFVLYIKYIGLDPKMPFTVLHYGTIPDMDRIIGQFRLNGVLGLVQHQGVYGRDVAT